MSNSVRIEKMTREGIAIMQEERQLVLKGDLSALDELNKRKIEFLGKMESLAQAESRLAMSKHQRDELETLFEIMRRRAEENQALLRAAAAGVKKAGRRIAAVHNQDQDFGAYNRDGSPVVNNNNLTNQSQIA